MQYMLLVYGEEKLWEELSKEEAERVADGRDRWAQELIRSGHSRGMAGFHTSATATTIRSRDGAVTITDGPFAETGETLGGYHLVECRNLDEAIAIARCYPPLQAGFSLEVRPVRPL